MIMPNDMGREPHTPPSTIEEWIEQTEETGILRFEQLSAIGRRVEVLAAEKADLAAGMSPRWWVCPQCGHSHKRGHFGAIGCHRCLTCGYTGSGGIMWTDDELQAQYGAGQGFLVNPDGEATPQPAPKLAEEKKEAMNAPVPMLPRLKAKEAIRRLRERTESMWLDAVVDAHGEGQEQAARESAINEASLKGKLREALAHIADLCSAIETQSPSVTNEFVENARKRARNFLERNV